MVDWPRRPGWYDVVDWPAVYLSVQGDVDDSEVCQTPDAPRGRTKAPRLDVYRPAPRVIVDTGRPHNNKPPQDQHHLQDKSKPGVDDPATFLAQSRTSRTVPSQAPQDYHHLQDKSKPGVDDPATSLAQSRTLRTVPSQAPQDYHHLQDKSKPGVNDPTTSLAQSRTSRTIDHRLVPSQAPQDYHHLQDKSKPGVNDPTTSLAQSRMSRTLDHRPVPSQAPQDHHHLQDKSKPGANDPTTSLGQSRTSRTLDHRPVPSQEHFQTSVSKDRLVADVHENMTESRKDGELHSQAVQVQTKPTRRQNAVILQDTLPDSSQTISQDHKKLQTLSRLSRVEPVENGASCGGGETKSKSTGVERTHHRQEEEDEKEQGQSRENKENRTTSTSAAADQDYAVKYRLGLVPRRSNEPKRRSEYQRQFQWRNFEQNSPLMSAAQVLTTLHVITLSLVGLALNVVD